MGRKFNNNWWVGRPMERFHKDEKFKGIYVRRCKCGARPHWDRLCDGYPLQWVACNCGRTAESEFKLQLAIDNWNNGKIHFD